MIDLEREYDNRGRVPEHPDLIAGWIRDGAAARAELPGQLDLRYGPGPRQTLDLFAPASATGATVVFFHGGYWQSQDRVRFAHLARGPLAHGRRVAVVGYDLCPTVTLAEIVAQARAATAYAAALTGAAVVVTGHSAGGHLAACVAATPGLPVVGCVALSGLFDLAPLLTTSLNAAVRLDAAAAAAWSPGLWPAPAGLPVDLVVGALESDEYHRQSRELAARWGAGGAVTRYTAVPGANHFTVIAPLADPTSALTRRLVALAA